MVNADAMFRKLRACAAPGVAAANAKRIAITTPPVRCTCAQEAHRLKVDQSETWLGPPERRDPHERPDPAARVRLHRALVAAEQPSGVRAGSSPDTMHPALRGSENGGNSS